MNASRSTWQLATGVALVVVAVALGLFDAQAWNWAIWPAIGRWLGGHWEAVAATLLAATGLVLVVRGSVWARRRGGSDEAQPRERTRLTSYRSVAVIFLVVAGAGLGAMTLMLVLAADAGNYQGAGNTTQLRVEAIKYGLGSLAAAGGAVGILLAVRRQRLAETSHQLAERTQSHTEADAAQRRVTELFTKAVDMLGHSDAAVRLGAIYALERVAGEEHNQQQTVVNVLCAYLRMPYSLPDDFAPVGGTEILAQLGPRPAKDANAPVRDPRQELQVRMAAQQVLTAHLAEPTDRPAVRPSFWENVSVDLSRAVLVSWSLLDGRLRGANFTGTLFVGDTRFTGTAIEGKSWFGGAVFTYSVQFLRTRFGGPASFGGTTFGGDTTFAGSTFGAGAHFKDVVFIGDAAFDGVEGADAVTFTDAAVRLGRNRSDMWPPGWRVESDPDDRTIGRLTPSSDPPASVFRTASGSA